MQLNQSGPHRRDWQRLEKSVSELNRFSGEDIEVTAHAHVAQTLTVYVTVSIATNDAVTERKYRYADHPECYASHDFSVWSGGGASRRQPLPPGFDGLATDAIADMRRWVDGICPGLIEAAKAESRRQAKARKADDEAFRRQAELVSRRSEIADQRRFAAIIAWGPAVAEPLSIGDDEWTTRLVAWAKNWEENGSEITPACEAIRPPK